MSLAYHIRGELVAVCEFYIKPVNPTSNPVLRDHPEEIQILLTHPAHSPYSIATAVSSSPFLPSLTALLRNPDPSDPDLFSQGL